MLSRSARAERADRRVPQGSRRPQLTAGPHTRGVLPKRDVADVVLTILDCPVPADAFPPGQRLLPGEPPGW